MEHLQIAYDLLVIMIGLAIRGRCMSYPARGWYMGWQRRKLRLLRAV